MPCGRPLVIGIGTGHRGDDAAGLLAARALRALIGEGDAAEIAEHSGDGAALIELWTGRDWVILVDALHSAGMPGRVLHFDASKQALPAMPEHGSTHAFGVSGAIELARSLDRLPARTEFYGITGNVFSMGATVSPRVRQAVGEVASAIAGRLAGATTPVPAPDA